MGLAPNLSILNLPAFTTRFTQLLIISLETVRMEKHALSNNQSGRLDLPQDYLDDHNTRYYTVPVKSVIRDD